MNISKQTMKRLAVILSAMLLLAATVLSVVFGLKSSGQTGTVNVGMNHNDSLIVTPEPGAAMTMSVLRAGDKTENVNPPSGDTDGISITATVGPETTANKEILWTLKWKTSSESGGRDDHNGGTGRASGWGEGKPLADYITLSSTSKSGESVTLTCNRDFGEQIIVTATSAENPEVSASCTVDYCQKIKSLDYAFKYGGNAITSPAADSDGVYRVDYTGEEKSYTVECTPVYTDYTVADEFVKSVSGKFTSAFGHTASETMSDVSLQAGLFGGTVQEGAVTSAAQEFINLVVQASKTGNFNACASMAATAQTMYDNLSETEKAHSRVVNVKSALDYLRAGLSDQRIDREDLDGTQEILNSYTPPASSGDFNGGVRLESENALLTAAKACNDAGTGILEYTITYTGVYSSKTFTLKLGYTASSVTAARTMNISLPSVMF